ncbi:hypothetical protein DFH07DRAFT_824348 [Mycena maculata]|uniref:Uncharacterized protein n=1 Tax=Mycena maculata TaxID=230809 RepID=A0AAD7J0L5_9AGAR|nr:hypothetical protein DFH07DRAFT_824348 [Mycena maculata]
MSELPSIPNSILPGGPVSATSASQTSASASPPPTSASSSPPASSASSGGGGGASPSDSGTGNSTSVSATGPGSSISSPASSAVVLTSASVSTGQSTYVSTSNGVVVTVTSDVTATFSAGSIITSAPHTDTTTTSHTGAIAGGVVGGVAALILAGLLIWFLRRRALERRREAEFDGNFDPGRTTGGAGPTLPQVSTGAGMGGMNGAMDAEEEDDGVGGRLAGSSIGGGVVTPFMAGVGAGAGAGAYQQQQHAYYPQQGYYAGGGGGGGYETTSEGGPLSPSMSSYYGPGSASHPVSAGPGPMSAASTSSGGYPNPLSAKEREARGGGFAVANPGSGMSTPMPAQGGSQRLPNPHSPGESGSGVVVHQDGGRVPQEEGEGMREIPPTYDSIRS